MSVVETFSAMPLPTDSASDGRSGIISVANHLGRNEPHSHDSGTNSCSQIDNTLAPRLCGSFAPK